jgi:hypothetical protein
MGHDAKQNPTSREFAGASEVLDSRGRALQEGDEIIVVLNGPTYMRVAKIVPALQADAPPGAMLITLSAAYQFGAMRGTVNPEFIRVRTVEEAGPLQPPTTEPAPKLGLVGQPHDQKEG